MKRTRITPIATGARYSRNAKSRALPDVRDAPQVGSQQTGIGDRMPVNGVADSTDQSEVDQRQQNHNSQCQKDADAIHQRDADGFNGSLNCLNHLCFETPIPDFAILR